MIGMATTIFLVNPVTFGSAFTNEKSILLDGVDEYVSLASTPSALVSATNFTFSCWVKNSSTNESIIEFFTSTTDNPLRVFLSTTNIQIAVRNTANSFGLCAFGTSASWRHICCVYDGGGATNADRLKFYVNGSLQTLSFTGTIPASTSSTTTHTYEQIARATNSTYYTGNIDETSIFDYSLNSTQVTALYNSGTPTDLDNTSGVTAPVHWWRMGDGSDTISTINDVGTTGGNNGTPTNMESGDIVTDTP